MMLPVYLKPTAFINCSGLVAIMLLVAISLRQPASTTDDTPSPTNGYAAAGKVSVDVSSSKTTVDFERHVAPMLGRLGCNSAACHGAFGGKGDLQLSLFGYSARRDYEHLRSLIDVDDPEQSLMLQKPSGGEDHEGGIRFEPKSATYRTIHDWIKSGAKWNAGSGRVTKLLIEPAEIVFRNFATTKKTTTQQLVVIAEFADGSREDVTKYCQFTSRDEGVATASPSGSVKPVRNGDTSVIVSYSNAFAAINTLVPFADPVRKSNSNDENEAGGPIDLYINKKLDKLNISASPLSNDAEFLRRVMIDTIGTIPTPRETQQFCDNTDPRKREQKIDELLAHPMHAALWATRMCDITKCDVGQMGEDETIRNRRAQMWHDWFRKRFADNTSYAEIARGILTATSREGLDVNDWMAREELLVRQSRKSFKTDYRDRDTLDMYWRRVGDDGKFPLKQTAELTAAAFTGVRLNCAQCHKHPFDRWTQDDYAAFTNIFSKVVYGSSSELNVAIFAELDRRRAAKGEGKKIDSLPRLTEVYTSDLLGREIAGAEKGARVHPRAFESEEFDHQTDPRLQFYEWLIKPDNPYFARNFANRIWSVYFGVGIVHPVDDFSISNPPSHPKLLEELARSFRDSDFDIRKLEKRILMSHAYQRTSTPNDTNRLDQRNYARQYVRPLLAEVAFDCINKVLGTKPDFGNDAPQNAIAIEIGANKLSGKPGRVLNILGRGERESICDCDRRTESDLRQFVFLINDKSIHKKIKSGSIQRLLKLNDDELVQQLYLRMLGRLPDSNESRIGRKHLADIENREQAFNDLIWALLNTREFITNH